MMHRVHMEASDGDYLIMLIPLEQNAELDVSAPDPIGLFKGTWDKASIYYGEIKVRASGVVLEWMGDWPETIPIDLEGQNIHVGAIFTLDSSDGRFRYTVRSVLAA